MARYRAETDAALSVLPPNALERPTIWSGYETDVRHRLHRFASHIAEHTIQCAKTIVALGEAGGDARGIARRIGYLRGLHERRSSAAVVAELDAALGAKADALTSSPVRGS